MNSNRTVYIYPSRFNGKTDLVHELVRTYQEAGYEVRFVDPKHSNLKGSYFRSVFIDKDVLTPARLERAEKILDDILKGV
jgi:hypothetical protein